MPEYMKLAKDVSAAIKSAVLENNRDLQEMGKKAFTGAYGATTSRMDSIAEEKALEIIASSDLKLNVLTEERGMMDNGASETIVLDPIDGTTNCISGIPFYSASIAFARGNRLSDVFFGYVENIPANEVYSASKGAGASIIVSGKSDPIVRKVFDPEKVTAIAYVGKHSKMPSGLGSARYFRCMGAASLEMCLVARGSADIYCHMSQPGQKLRIVDIAASVLITREAGCFVLDENFNDLEMNIDLQDRKNVIAVRDKKALEVLK